MPRLTADETDVLLALERLATRGVQWHSDDPSDLPGPSVFFPDRIPPWLLRMYVAGDGSVTTGNRVLFAEKGLHAIGYITTSLAKGPPSWLILLPFQTESQSWHVRCCNGVRARFARTAPNCVVVTRPDRPQWEWRVDYGNNITYPTHAITAAGALAARSLIIGSPSVLPSSEQIESPLKGPALQLGHNLENQTPERVPEGITDQSRAERKRAGGRPLLSKKEAEKRKDLVEEWQRAKGAGTRQKEFCEDRSIDLKHLAKCVNWLQQRRRRGGDA